METLQENQRSAPEFKSCTGCKTIHFVSKSITDARPSCAECGGTDFELYTGQPTGVHTPVYANQNLENSVWEGSLAVILSPITDWKTRMEIKHGVKFSKADIQDLAHSIATIGRQLINMSRDSFDRDRFVRSMRNVYRSYLFRRQKFTNNKKPTNNA